ncbi:MAG: Ig-like domain-containing protein [Prosthecobacter sp.]|nr:Ig-like domain-containing protein [Prosthecobacter sp.]
MQHLISSLLVCCSVAASAASEAPSFRNTIQPILTRYGCNAGACHGAAAGQGGFRLSLRGFDDQGDWLSVTHSAMGRRITLEDPARSLLLLKATKTVPHKGDKRFEVNSAEYQALADWVAHGVAGPKAEDARITALEVTPNHLVTKAGANQQLKVMAKFSNGLTEDVTRWTKFTATNASVATVDDTGLIKPTGQGEGTVSAWYLSRLAIVTVTVPSPTLVDAALFAQMQPRNFIDEQVLTKLRELNTPPSCVRMTPSLCDVPFSIRWACCRPRMKRAPSWLPRPPTTATG